MPPRARKKSKIPSLVVITIIALVSVGLYFYVAKKPATTLNKAPGIVADQLAPQKDWPTQDGPQKLEGIAQEQDTTPEHEELTSTLPEARLDDQPESAGSQAGSAKEALPLDLNIPDIAADTNTGGKNRQLVDTINAFYIHLDQQLYIQDLALQQPSKVYFSKLLQKLADHPPTVIRETDNLYTLLNNTAHFYRLLGKKNIVIIKKILAMENNSFEKNANALYQLTAYPEELKKEFNLSIPPKAITDYGAFFLNTMGGRLYLFRRDSTTRMVVTFYAIMAINRANSAGNGGHGIDLRPAIPALIEEMENGGRLLQFKEQYLDTLYDLQEKYN